MANEVIKIITGYGSVLSGKILVLNIKDYEFSLLEIPDNPENHKRKQLDEKY
jgi:molybdopterin/thiamine biosynthesis adenylyltransferase